MQIREWLPLPKEWEVPLTVQLTVAPIIPSKFTEQAWCGRKILEECDISYVYALINDLYLCKFSPHDTQVLSMKHLANILDHAKQIICFDGEMYFCLLLRWFSEDRMIHWRFHMFSIAEKLREKPLYVYTTLKEIIEWNPEIYQGAVPSLWQLSKSKEVERLLQTRLHIEHLLWKWIQREERITYFKNEQFKTTLIKLS